MIMAMSGCGDYESVSIPSLDLSKEQEQSLMAVQIANLTCAAISRYSNDIGSPIEDQSYLSNAETAFELFKSSKKLNKDQKLKADKLYQNIKSEVYNEVISSLNDVSSLQQFYNDEFPPLQKMLNVKKINDCADVSAVTRRVLDPLLIL